MNMPALADRVCRERLTLAGLDVRAGPTGKIDRLALRRAASRESRHIRQSEVATAAAGGTAASFTVMQFNMWGWIGYRGSNEIAHATAKSIRDHRPAVVTLNEVCLAQVETAISDLDAWGLTYQWHHDLLLHRQDESGFCDFGNAILWLSDEPREREPEKQLSIPSKEQARKILSVRVDCLRLPTLLCVTHLTSGWTPRTKKARERQVMEVADHVASWKRRGVEVILGGDFNEQPDSPRLDPMYLPAYGGGSRGICHEATCTGEPGPGCRQKPFEPTHDAGVKYDYIFLTTGYRPQGAKVTHSHSDHHAYYATIV